MKYLLIFILFLLSCAIYNAKRCQVHYNKAVAGGCLNVKDSSSHDSIIIRTIERDTVKDVQILYITIHDSIQSDTSEKTTLRKINYKGITGTLFIDWGKHTHDLSLNVPVRKETTNIGNKQTNNKSVSDFKRKPIIKNIIVERKKRWHEDWRIFSLLTLLIIAAIKLIKNYYFKIL